MPRARRAALAAATAAVVAAGGGGAYAATQSADPAVTACRPAVTSNVGFSDVSSSTQFANSIYCLADLGIAGGFADGTYKPAAAVSRQQMATFFYRLACSLQYTPASASDAGPTPEQCKRQLPTTSVGFGDVGGSGEQVDAINFMANTKVAQGTGTQDGRPVYAPTAAITRAQMAAFIDRFQAYAGHKKGAPGQDPLRAGEAGGGTGFRSTVDAFSDDNGSVLQQHINDVSAAGVAGGYTDGTYRPNNTVPRMAMAEFLARQMQVNSDRGNWVFASVR